MAINKGYLTAKTDKASDEVFTPRYAVTPLLKYLQTYVDIYDKFAYKTLTIWCPFDTEDSNYVKVFQEAGYKVIASHIDNGQNFFDYEPESYDIIISNPPFSIKDDILKRLVELNKPFAMLFPLPVLQGQKRFDALKAIATDNDKDMELIIFDKRINFYKDKSMKEIQKGVSFASIYICNNFINWSDSPIKFEELDTSEE